MNHFRCKGYRRLRALGVGIIAFSLLFIPGRALGEDWIWLFHVPVELKKIPKEVKYVGVTAGVYDKNLLVVAMVKKLEPLDTKTGSFKKTTKGNTVDLYVFQKDLKPGKYPKDGKTYLVTFFLSTNGQDVLLPNDGNQLTQVKPGTEFVPKDEGPVTLEGFKL